MKPISPVAEAILNSLVLELADEPVPCPECPACNCPALKWDAEEPYPSGENVWRSADKLTLYTDSNNGGSARSNITHASGKWSARFDTNFTGDPTSQEVSVGVGVPEGANIALLTAEGKVNNQPGGPEFANGNFPIVLVDCDAGEVRFVSSVFADPTMPLPAPVATFTPGDPVALAASLYAVDGIRVEARIVPVDWADYLPWA